MDKFLNEYVMNSLPALIVFVVWLLPSFGYFYNKLMDRLTSRLEHTSLYVAIGVAVTIAVGALFSWKAALMYLILFGLSGLPMIIGEFKRTERKIISAKAPRRKRLPYAANGRIEDAYDYVKEGQRLIDVAMKNNGQNVESALPLAEATTVLNRALTNLMEVKMIQNVEK